MFRFSDQHVHHTSLLDERTGCFIYKQTKTIYFLLTCFAVKLIIDSD